MLRQETLTGHLIADDGKGAVYLAETTQDLFEQREALRRDLKQHGYTVFPARGLPLIAPQMTTAIKEELEQCRMSIHLIGSTYGAVPEGSTMSMVEIQNELAIERGKKGGFSRLLWIPAGMKIEDERQARVIEQFRMDSRLQEGADLLETYLEDLRTVIYDRLHKEPKATTVVASASADEVKPFYIYILYDQRDFAAVKPYADELFDQGFEILHPCFEGGEADLRQYHEENLRICNAALLIFGSVNAAWIRQKLREIQKSVGYGRTEPLPKIAILCVGSSTAEKESFRTHEALVLSDKDGSDVHCLQPFVEKISPR